MKNDIIDFLQDRSILILGFGREGKSFLQFAQANLPSNKIAIADQNDIQVEGVETFCGPDYLAHVAEFDVIIKSPGVVRTQLSALPARRVRVQLHR